MRQALHKLAFDPGTPWAPQCLNFLMCEVGDQGTHLPETGLKAWHPGNAGSRAAHPTPSLTQWYIILGPDFTARTTGRGNGRNRDHLISKSLKATHPKIMEPTSLSL